MNARRAVTVIAMLCSGCLGRLDALVKEQKRESAIRDAPPWALAAKENSELPDGGYEQRLSEAPKRTTDEVVHVTYCIESQALGAQFLAAAPPGTRREYLADAFVPSLNATLAMVLRAFSDPIDQGLASPRITAGAAVGNCQPGPTWYDQVTNTYDEADVYLWLSLELRPMPQCAPALRGYHATARWSSAYERQENVFELDFCQATDGSGKSEGGRLVAAHVFEHVNRALRPALPAAAVAVKLTPPHRWSRYLKAAELRGGGGHGHHH